MKAIKHVLISIAAIAILSTSALAFQHTNLYNVNKYTCNVRPAICIVTEVDGESISLTDSYGNVWEANGYEDLGVNDFVAVAFSDNGTKEIYDDSIIAVWYQRIDLLEKYIVEER